MQSLTEVRDTELWKVEGTSHQKVAAGLWSLYKINDVAYSQVGSIQWQLTGSSPCLKPADGSYVFALSSQQQTIYYIVRIPHGLPELQIDAIETALASITAFEISATASSDTKQSEDIEKVTDEKPTTTDQIVSGIGKATTYAVQGISYGAHALKKTIHKGGELFKEKTTKGEEDKPVDEKTKKRLETAKKIGKTASAVTAVAVDTVATLTTQVASAVVSAVSGNKDGDSDRQQESTSTKVKKVGIATAAAAAEIYLAMEDAFKQIAQSGAETTATMVEHKYGKEYGDATYDALSATGHTAEAVMSGRKLGPKAVLKATAKKTAVEYVKR